VLLHMATMAPERVRAMAVVSRTPYFPSRARAMEFKSWQALIALFLHECILTYRE
jgi:hypothetical protein